jgi:TonB family protein
MIAPPPPGNSFSTPLPQSCAQPNKDVSVVTAATPPPTEYQSEVTSPTLVAVAVTVDADGSVIGASIYKSSGNEKLDKAALIAARSSSFSPRVVDCSPMRSNYLIRIHFAPPSPEPSPSAQVISAPLRCVASTREAKVTTPVAPDLPADIHGPLEAVVKVTVAADGSVKNVSVYRSSGNVRVDEAMLTAAKQATYSPKIVNCTAVEGDYLFRVQLTP